MAITYPEPFLVARVDNTLVVPSIVGFCAGFEGGEWRSSQLADHLFNWLPYAALDQEHQLAFQASNFVEMLKRASAHIYNTKKTGSRGEIGELLLHLTSILHFKTVPVICKLTLKTSANDTVKGFDGIHVLLKEDGDFEIWLGESKFYTDAKEAIKEAVASVKDHILPAFLNTEKAMIYGHVGKDIPNREKIIKVLKPLTSSDELLAHAVFPILIAYESQSVSAFKAVCTEYEDALRTEVELLRAFFGSRAAELTLKFRLIFIPMKSKTAVIESFDAKLEAFR